MKTIAMFAGAALLSLGLAGNAAAADGAALYASKGCAACHGADGKTPIMPVYPKLAGQNAQYALNQMKDIKSGARSNGQTAAMKGIVMSVSEEELQAIAEWLAAQ
ncbi:c-type cytochrome [Sedimenticola selenatireducens]|uniref:c-type cytochrome n=1 Tax=Sedimenticola selenatireducens TaxID=191960 RepID=UPI002AAAA398|nr:c-type cytochrome [Sedimenticola selenatireducens]